MAGLACSVLGVLVSLQPVRAFTFEQQEVSQEKFVAIAVPLSQADGHSLLILEQIAADQKCWKEEAGIVDPLLLNFDFTGICGRSTDSNGYSIRVAGKDLGLDYKLSVRKRGGALVLVGYSYRDPRAPELEVGRTTQAEGGFLKIDLAPGWRFAKRAYDGKTLGHIYLTRDTFPTTAPSTAVAESADQEIEKADPTAASVDSPSQKRAKRLSQKTVKATAPRQRVSKKDDSQDSPSALKAPVSIPVPKAKTLTPKAPSVPLTPPTQGRQSTSTPARSSGSFTTPIQIPVPAPRTQSRTTPQRYQPPAPPVSTASRGLPTLAANVLPVPDGTIPLGNARNRANVYQGLPPAQTTSDGGPPPPPIRVAWAKHRYRVVVDRGSASQQSKIRNLAPDAFRSTYQGRPVFQVGAYESQEEADNMAQFMTQNGFKGIIERR